VITKPSDYELHAELFSGVNEKLVIICHGGLGDRQEHGRFPYAAKILAKNGYDVLLFDFTGSGDNERVPFQISSMVEDLEAVWKWAKKQNYRSIDTIGLSLGGLVSLIAKLPGRNKAIFWAPAFYEKDYLPPFHKLLSKIIPRDSKLTLKLMTTGAGPRIHFRISFINELLELDVEPYLRNFEIPTLIIQGTRDLVVNPKSSKMAFSIMPQDEKHVIKLVHGAPHDFKGKKLDEFIKYSLDFLRKKF
jgi:pimeloyl-ACP methyl ester carboxylesterase